MTNDKELVEKALENQEAFEEIITAYESKLDRFLSRLGVSGSEDREDLLQEIFWKVYKNLNGFDADMSFSAWIYRIARNTTYDFFRRIKSRPQKANFSEEEAQFFWENLSDERDEFTQQYDQKQQKQVVAQILQKMPEKYREVLILLFLEDRSYAEISDILKKNENSVATLISRGKQQFKQLFLRHANLDQI